MSSVAYHTTATFPTFAFALFFWDWLDTVSLGVHCLVRRFTYNRSYEVMSSLLMFVAQVLIVFLSPKFRGSS